MILSQDKALIIQLIKKYAEKPSTEAMITFVADNNGMLAACKLLAEKNTEDDDEFISWVDEQCYTRQIDVRDFLYVVNQVLSIFHPKQEYDEHYGVLDLEVGATEEEIKEAFRKLSRRYHPDTASLEGASDTEKFTEINKAYRALLNRETEEQDIVQPQESNGHWRAENKRHRGELVKKKNILLFVALTLGMIVISFFAARGYQQKAMITGLQRSHVVFVPSASKVEEVVEKTREDHSVESVEPVKLADELSEPVREIGSEPVAKTRGAEILEAAVTVDGSEAQEEQEVLEETKKLDSSPSVIIKIEKAKPLPVLSVKEDAPKKEEHSRPTALESQEKESVIPSPEEIKKETQKRIDSFLAAYIRSYERKDLPAFSSFFDLKATENGDPLEDILPAYTELFQQAETISLAVSMHKWQQKQENISVDGRFTIHITYKNSNKVQGEGDIRFLLADVNMQLSIKDITYHFDKQ